MTRLIIVFFFLLYIPQRFCFPSTKDLMATWCGDQNCYDVLNIQTKADTKEISVQYKKLAIKYHPDKNRGRKDEVEDIMQKITVAYTILKDAGSRKRYDEVVRIKKNLFVPKENPIFVAFLLLFIIAAFSHYYRLYRRKVKVRKLLENEAVRRRLQLKLCKSGKKPRIKNNSIDGEVSESLLYDVVQEMGIKIPGGFEREPPSFVIVLKAIPSAPFIALKQIWFSTRWTFLFTLLNRPLGHKEKEYLTIQNLGLTKKDWEGFEQEEKEKYMKKKLWVPVKRKLRKGKED